MDIAVPKFPSPSRLRPICVAAIVVTTSLAIAPGPALAQTATDCGHLNFTVSRGGEVIYEIPGDEGRQIRVKPADVLDIRATGLSTAGRVEFTALLPFGGRVTRTEPWSGLEPGQTHQFNLDLADYSDIVRGAFDMEIAVYSGETLQCVLEATTVVEEFGGTMAIASTAGTGVTAGITAVGVAQGASSANVKLNTEIAVQRRRRRGWRKLTPVIAWRRTIWSTFTGCITGLFAAIALQQTGQIILDSYTMAAGAAGGGGLSFGVNLVWGSLLSLVRSSGVGSDDFYNGPGSGNAQG